MRSYPAACGACSQFIVVATIIGVETIISDRPPPQPSW
jgi:hypothetical protein